jgi:regulator of protease activity HflC (stomatin/prohibitin superfamily)
VRDAFNQVIASKRLMEAARNEAEAQRIKLVGAAQAEAESKKLQGEGMAQMREAVARGLEVAMATMARAGLSSEMAIQFLSDTNRLDTITSAASHGNTIIIDAGANKDLAGMAAMLDSIKK